MWLNLLLVIITCSRKLLFLQTKIGWIIDYIDEALAGIWLVSLHGPDVRVREQQFEARATAWFTGYADRPVEPVNQSFDDGQAYSKARGIDIATAMKRLESLVQILLVHTSALIADDHLLAINGYPYDTIVGVIDCITNQVTEDHR